jgi:uncharacterized protein
MRISRIIFAIILSLWFISCKTKAHTENRTKRVIPELNYTELEKKNFPKSLSFVNDFEHLLSNEQILDLEILINDYRIKTKKEIVIITIDSINPYTEIANYSVDISNYLGVGKNDGNGLTIVVSKKLRKVQISTGNETEKIITDGHSQKVIDKLMIPNFKSDKYYEGIKTGLLELIKIWD